MVLVEDHIFKIDEPQITQFFLNPKDAEAKLEGLIERLLDKQEQEALGRMLAGKKASMIQPNRAMWQETVTLLKARSMH